MRLLSVVFALIMPLSGAAAQSQEIRAYLTSALSNDGETIVFEWLDDLWIAPTKGGDAKRLVQNPARDAYPQFSADGKRVLFSSERSGSLQIYSVGLDGTDPRQHSHHTEGNCLEAVAQDGSYALARGLRESSGFRPSRLVKIDLRQTSRELPLFDATAHSVSVSPDGKRFLFCRQGEQLYRGAYQGARASEIHLYNESARSFELMIDEAWEARNPMWCADGNGFYYLSNATGEFNLWLRRFDGSADRQLTFFKNDSVLLPAISKNGKVMVFRVGYKIYRFEPEGKEPPVEVRFVTDEILPPNSRREKITGTNMAVFADEGERIVFSAAGDLWTMRKNDQEPMRLTKSDGSDERELQISQDAKTIYYLSDQGLKVDVIMARLGEKSLGDEKVLCSNPGSKKNLRLSPDGGSVSWLEATGDLVICRLSEQKPRVVMRNWDMPTYDWSPDGKWLVVAAKDLHSNRDIWLVPANGHGEAYNLTKHPGFEGSPKWSPDGKHIAFLGRRDLDESLKIWQMDVPEQLAGPGQDVSAFDKMSSSAKPLDTGLKDIKQLVWSADSKSLLYQNGDIKDEKIHSHRLQDGQIAPLANFRGIHVGRSGTGKTYWRKDRVPVVLDGSNLHAYEFSFDVEQVRSERLRLGFRKIWRTLGERFYDDSMNGKNWESIREKYEDVASESRNGREFDRVIAKMLGELNASHLTFHYTPWEMVEETEESGRVTAHPGLEFVASWEGPLVIQRVIPETPIANADQAPVPGEIVRRINGHDVNGSSDLSQFFNGAKDRVIPMVVEGKDGKIRTMDLVPVSYETIRSLHRKQIESAAKMAAQEHGLVYLPFLKMKSEDLERLRLDVYRASISGKGVILDLRDNAGGRVADELLALFCQPDHAFTIPRNGPRGYPTDRRVSPAWNGPMVVIANGNTYSNAEIFCHAFKQLGRGKLIGEPTNGGVISAVDVDIPEVGRLQIPFRGWFHAKTGKDLELNGAVPDVMVPMLPNSEVQGVDPQLMAAIKVLKDEIAKSPEIVEPKLKSTKGK